MDELTLLKILATADFEKLGIVALAITVTILQYLLYLRERQRSEALVGQLMMAFSDSAVTNAQLTTAVEALRDSSTATTRLYDRYFSELLRLTQ